MMMKNFLTENTMAFCPTSATDVDAIRTQDLRDYLEFLDDHREGILSANSKSKHLIVIRKILNLAREKGVIAHYHFSQS